MLEGGHLDNPQLRDDLIHALVPLVLFLARKWCRRYPSKGDDILSTALLQLVIAVPRFLRKAERDNNISGYVSSSIHFKLRQFIRTDQLIVMPYGSIHYLIKNGVYDSLNVSVLNGYAEQTSFEHVLSKLFKRSGISINDTFLIKCTPETDVRDVMKMVLKTDEDRRLIELKIIGCSDKEIAKDLKRSTSFVQKKRNELISLLRLALADRQ